MWDAPQSVWKVSATTKGNWIDPVWDAPQSMWEREVKSVKCWHAMAYAYFDRSRPPNSAWREHQIRSNASAETGIASGKSEGEEIRRKVSSKYVRIPSIQRESGTGVFRSAATINVDPDARFTRRHQPVEG